MSGDHHRNPIEWFLHLSLMILIAALALNWALGLLTPLIPWFVLGGLVTVAVMVVVAKRRNKW